MDIDCLQEIHEGGVHLGQESYGEDERKGEDEGEDEVSADVEIRGGQPRGVAVQTEARELTFPGLIKAEKDETGEDEVNRPREDGDGVVTVGGRAGVRLD